MLINLVEWWVEQFGEFPGSRLVNYISFRAGVAAILSLLISMVLGGRIIRGLKKLQVGETVRDLGLHGQKLKEGTPTMGGIIIVMAIIIPCLLIARLDNIYIKLMITSTLWMAVIGFVDDYIKVFKKNKQGLKGKFKILGQVGLGLIIGVVMLSNEDVVVRMSWQEAQSLNLGVEDLVPESKAPPADSTLADWRGDFKTCVTNIPFFKDQNLDYAKLLPFETKTAQKWVWLIFIPLVIFIVTAVSNAANLTDGLDGLATGTSGIAGFTLAVFAYVSGNVIAANYLDILYLPGISELVVFSACLVGGCLGFLWYNTYPAQVFMGDTGSLTLGGVIASMAILLRKEWLIPILCGIFLVESLSVMIQVFYFKYTKRKYGEGRRVFLMSPLHHHYQKKGWHEVKIVTRFWIVGILLAILTLITLKTR